MTNFFHTKNNMSAFPGIRTLKSSAFHVIRCCFVLPLIIAGPGQGAKAEDASAIPEGFTVEFLSQAADHIRATSSGGASDGISESSDPHLGEANESADIDDALSSDSAIYSGQEVTIVEAATVAVGPGTEKLLPDDVPILPNLEVQFGEPSSKLTFASGDFTPLAGVDERLQHRASATTSGDASADEQFTYAFALTSEYLSDKVEEEMAALGVEVLGLHDDAIKIRLPLDASVLEQVIELPYVDWIGYSQPEQKIDPTLGAVGSAFSSAAIEFPIIINLFDDDATGSFAERLANLGVDIGSYDPELMSYRAVASESEINALIDLDFVLYVEVEQPTSGGHDQSMSTMGVDYIRPGGPGRRFGGASTIVGIADSGFDLPPSAPVGHVDLSKFACGRNFTTDTAGVFDDEHGHGTHVLGTIAGTGTANARYRGAAPSVGSTAATRIRAAKIWRSDNRGFQSWMENAMDYMGTASECGSGRPLVINISGGASGTNLTGTDSTSRKLDAAVWSNRQAYVISAGNDGPGVGTIGAPAAAKNALTVGNVQDDGFLLVGDINISSSRGPTGDDRMKPNLTAVGTSVTSTEDGTTNQYQTFSGTSMAAPHITGMAATLMEHYPAFRSRPDLLRSYMMATSVLHDDAFLPANNSQGGRNTYGLGRASSSVSHWGRPGANGWSGRWAATTVNNQTWRFTDITVPAGTDRLVVVMSWDEPAASAGASRAVTYDLDLWVDRGADCTADGGRRCGEWASQSLVDNTEYLVINSPPPGRYRLKMVNFRAPAFNLPVSVAANIILGDPTPAMTLTARPSTTTPSVGSIMSVSTVVTNPAYVASGVHLGLAGVTAGLQLLNVSTTREDLVPMNFSGAVAARNGVTLGNVRERDSRIANWTFRVLSAGNKFMTFRAWSENGGTRTATVNVQASN